MPDLDNKREGWLSVPILLIYLTGLGAGLAGLFQTVSIYYDLQGDESLSTITWVFCAATFGPGLLYAALSQCFMSHAWGDSFVNTVLASWL